MAAIDISDLSEQYYKQKWEIFELQADVKKLEEKVKALEKALKTIDPRSYNDGRI
jgi:polyhydroxyalkanoate synthesis regulator phasin